MLCDNALLVGPYLEAFQAAGDPFYAKVARETLGYVLREMTDEKGGFHASQDADTEGEEGRYYVWTPDEIRRVLARDDAELFCRFYDVTENGNFEGGSILHVAERVEGVARRMDAGATEMERRLARV